MFNASCMQLVPSNQIKCLATFSIDRVKMIHWIFCVDTSFSLRFSYFFICFIFVFWRPEIDTVAIKCVVYDAQSICVCVFRFHEWLRGFWFRNCSEWMAVLSNNNILFITSVHLFLLCVSNVKFQWMKFPQLCVRDTLYSCYRRLARHLFRQHWRHCVATAIVLIVTTLNISRWHLANETRNINVNEPKFETHSNVCFDDDKRQNGLVIGW